MTVKIALLGAGTVGTQVARLLLENNALLSARAGDKLELIGISVRNLNAERDRVIDRSLLTTDSKALIEKADIVIELIGGIEPARTLVMTAIESGASMVTGNKALLGQFGPEIYAAAEKANVDVYFEAAAAGAVPVVYALRESMAGDQVESVAGILNGTTNFILDEMTTNGMDFGEALALAQELGYAEADPTADVDGYDAAAKTAILASLAFNTRVLIDDVAVAGIRNITTADIATAKESGYVFKLVGKAIRTSEGIEARVDPTLVPDDHPLASVHGSYNSVVVEAEAAGRLMFYGRGAGGAPTASAVLSDVVAAAAKKVTGGQAPREVVVGNSRILPPSESISRYQISIGVVDRVGMLAEITAIFASHGVSISQVNQRRATRDSIQRVTLTTHEAKQANIDATISKLGELEGVEQVFSVFRVEGN